ncbi:tetratricopeptide repeat protein [Roseibium sp.]|uniref:tetratricopeptide repeat protein n=1 Tax=Roseibium sp. TaxID=1936156 RepID=UPI003A96FEB5
MSDIFREVDEDIRQEKYRRLWDRFGPWVMVLAVFIVVGTGGYRGWLYWQETQAQASGEKFQLAVTAAEGGKFDEADALLSELAQAGGGYPALARLRDAALEGERGEKEVALAAFDAISADSSLDKSFRDVAALRAALLAADTGDYDAVADRAEPLTGDTNPFRASAREILAIAAWKAGDIGLSRTWITAIEEDTETPTDVSRRIALLNDVIVAAEGTPAATDDAAVEGGN